MSRFDDFAKSRAEGRGLFSALKRTRPGAELDGDAGVSRRDLMKKAGLVTGAAVVGSTLIQSVTAPAFASSVCVDGTQMCGGPNCPTQQCGVGGVCQNDAGCLSPNTCVNGVCTAPPPPINNSQPCATSGSQQVKDSSCLSGYCAADNTCQTPTQSATLGQPCHGATQSAATNNCVSTQVCSGWTIQSGSGTCKVADSGTCIGGNSGERNASCASGDCTTGNPKICKKSAGATCSVASSECASGLTCPAGFCV